MEFELGSQVYFLFVLDVFLSLLGLITPFLCLRPSSSFTYVNRFNSYASKEAPTDDPAKTIDSATIMAITAVDYLHLEKFWKQNFIFLSS